MTRVLIVDDKVEGLYLLRSLLQAHGCEVDEARHGAEALTKARLSPPDLVISDLLMPVMDGYTLLRQWRTDERLRRIPFAVFTATYTEPMDERLALDLGADVFITKPADPEPFMARIRGIVAGGGLTARPPAQAKVTEEAVLLKQYNEVLVRKLEDKALRLERVTRDLAAREAHLRAILECEPECVKLLAPDGVLLEMNPAGLKMLEADTFAQVANCSILPFIGEEHRAAFEALGNRVLRGESGTLEFQVQGLKGGRRWLETHASPLRDASGTVTAILGVTRDITEHRRGEAEIREAKERLQRAVIAGKVGLWDWNLRTDKVIYSSEWKHQIGYRDEEISDDLSEWQGRVHPGDLDRVLQTTQAYLRGNDPDYESEYRFRHKNGSYRQILARGSEARGEDGTRIRLLGSHVDITERTELQAQLLQAQKMESVGQLAGGVAHDFNNLLTVINGTADLALMNLKDGDPLAAQFGQIRQAGNRAASLTRQLLAFSRRQMMKLEVLSLNDVVADMQGMLRRLIGEHIELAVVLAKRLGAVKADRGQIEQVILNLAVNAQDAMPGGGRLAIETREVDLDEAYAAEHPSVRPGPHVMLIISDTGFGMDEETRSRVFEPFFTTKGPGKGTGLGLSMVYGIVKQSGGSIWVTSGPGKGTTFEIHLPRAGDAAHRAEPARMATSARGAETVLIVEDEESVRDLATHILKTAGYRILAASSGKEALLLLKRHRGMVHLLMTDVVMPGMSGRDLAKRVAGSHPKMRILYTSGYTDDAILRHGVLDQEAQFIGKPYDVTALTRKVREVLDSPGGRRTKK